MTTRRRRQFEDLFAQEYDSCLDHVRRGDAPQPDRIEPDALDDVVATHATLIAALNQLPDRQRAAVLAACDPFSRSTTKRWRIALPDLRPDHQETIERVIGEGNRRLRRRRMIGAGGVLGLAVMGALVVLPRNADDQELETAVPLTLPTTTTPYRPAVDPPPGCRNSYEERCGEFYWDYDPDTLPNEPLEVSYTIDPPAPVAGEPISVVLTMYDPDFQGNCVDGPTAIAAPGASDLGVPGCPIPFCAAPEPQPYGPWDPPPPPTSPTPPDETAFFVTYHDPGDYEIQVVASGNPSCDQFPGYASAALVTIPISVGH